MFDLDEQVRLWRQSLALRLPDRAEAIDEMESHLRDAVERLLVSGMPADDAWKTALAQLGGTEEIAAEFAKVATVPFYRWLPARMLMIVYATFALGVGCLAFSKLAGRCADPLLAMHVFTLILGNTAVFAVGALGAWSIVSRALWGWTERESAALRSAARWWAGGGLMLTLLGVVLGSVWARDHMGRFWSWDVRESSALGVLLWNGLMLGLLTWRSHSERLVMLFGQAGNVVVALCWLGPAFQRFAQQFNGSILAAVSTPLAIFLLIELFLVGLTFVRPGRMNISRG